MWIIFKLKKSILLLLARLRSLALLWYHIRHYPLKSLFISAGYSGVRKTIGKSVGHTGIVFSGPGVTFAEIVGYVPVEPRKFDFLYTNYSPNYTVPTHQYSLPFSIICSKYTQFFNLGSFVSDENPTIATPNSTKMHLKRQTHTMSMWEPPGFREKNNSEFVGKQKREMAIQNTLTGFRVNREKGHLRGTAFYKICLEFRDRKILYRR